MTGSQSRPGAGRDGARGSWRSIRRTIEPLVAGGLVAHVSVAALTRLHVQPSLLIALVATLVFAGIGLEYARRIDGRVSPSSGRLVASLAADAVIIVIVGAGGWLIGRTLGSGAAFYCDPLVPWRIEIAPAGGFGVALRAVHIRCSPSPSTRLPSTSKPRIRRGRGMSGSCPLRSEARLEAVNEHLTWRRAKTRPGVFWRDVSKRI